MITLPASIGAFKPSAGSGDPYWANTSSLLHFDGSNGSTSFTDEKGKIWTPSGNAQISTAQSRFGGASGYFDGTGDWIDVAPSTDYQFGTGPFTIEGFFYSLPRSQNRAIFSIMSNWTLYLTAGDVLTLFDGSTNILGAGFRNNNNWHYFALLFDGTNIKISADGGSFSSSPFSMNLSSTNFRIGAAANGTSNFYGYIDEFRITKGIARYPTAPAVPSSPFPNFGP